jgi:hypothetical protein
MERSSFQTVFQPSSRQTIEINIIFAHRSFFLRVCNLDNFDNLVVSLGRTILVVVVFLVRFGAVSSLKRTSFTKFSSIRILLLLLRKVFAVRLNAEVAVRNKLRIWNSYSVPRVEINSYHNTIIANLHFSFSILPHFFVSCFLSGTE